MPVIRDIPLSLKTKEVLRREGFKGYSNIGPEIKSISKAVYMSCYLGITTLDEERSFPGLIKPIYVPSLGMTQDSVHCSEMVKAHGETVEKGNTKEVAKKIQVR